MIQHNINGYKNGKNHCRQLYEFQRITDTFRSFLDQGLTALEAIENTLNQIPPDFTIRDLLLQYRNEVTDMWLFEYDQNEHIAMERRDSEARGEAIGEARGKVEERVRILKRKIGKGMTFEQACADLELTEKEIEEIKSSF
ncbi:MAG: hypothetical protein IJ252_14415 [Solobacterium sp.]|nr:hypothetical protein [Solobacterium sp.]